MDTINNNLIVFESTPDFADNSRGFYEYIKNNKEYETFWIIRDEKMYQRLQNQGISCALFGTKEANDKIDTAHYFITSSFEFAYYKKIGQIHISAWHGFPLKLIGFFESASASLDFKNLKVITTQSDIVTATSRFSQLTLSGQFSLDPRKVKITGYPRNDIMLNADAKNELKKITDIDIDNSKLFLYLPTMRKGLKDEGQQFDNNIFNYSDYNIEALESFLEQNNAYIFVKMHFADNDYYTNDSFSLPKRIIFINTDKLNENLLTIYHIANAFDALITDYSSIYVDYLLLDKPILFTCPDILEYKKDRGFIVDNPELLMPGQTIKNQNDLIKSLKDVICGKDKYIDRRHDSMSIFHTYKDSNSSCRLLNQMIDQNDYLGKDSNKEIGTCFIQNNTPLSQYLSNYKAEVYFNSGNGFSEDNKLIIDYNSHDKILFSIDIDKDINQVRFDPDIYKGLFIKDLVIKVDNDIVRYDIVNILKINDNAYLCEDDPQIHIHIPEGAKILSIHYKCNNINSNIDELNKNIKELILNKNKLDYDMEIMLNSLSWKITKPLRKISKLFRKK